MALPFYNWSRTAASNATADSTVNWAEGQAPSSVNDSARAMMASTAGYRDDTSGALVTAGTSTAYTLTSREVFDTLAHMDGAALAFTVNATCGASPTLNVDGLGAKTIVASSGNPIAAGLLVINTPYVVTYNNASTEFRLHGVYGVAVSSQNYLTGLTLSTAGSSATFAIAIGAATDSTNASLMSLASAYTKTTSAWALGTAAGALDTGAIANSTWYHVFVIKRIDTGVVDVLISTSLASPTMPTNYTLFRRIGSMKTDGSAQWTKFIQVGDEFIWDVFVLDTNGSGLQTVSTLFTMTVPPDLSVLGRFRYEITTTSGTMRLDIQSPLITTRAASAASSLAITDSSGGACGEVNVMTDTSKRIRAVANASGGTQSTSIGTHGWRDTRGK